MPAKPVWLPKLDEILQKLRDFDRPLIDRPALEFMLGIGPRRAQQIMAPCIVEWIGTSGLADREALIARLERLAAGDEAYYEIQRRRKVAIALERLRRDRLERPQLWVEAPVGVVDQQFAELPPGIHLGRGRITVEFDQPQQALEKLLVLAMAISNDFDRFDRTTRRT